MSEIERYLRGATKGLWGRQRQALRAELLGHVQQRVRELQMGGRDQREAERLTLRELGAPAQVARGMAGVYALPTLTRTGLALAVSATLLLGALPQGLAQVQSIFGSQPQTGARSYLDLGQLRVELSKVGGQLGGAPGRLTISVPGAPRQAAEIQTAGWPGGATLHQDGRTFIDTALVVNALRRTGTSLRLSGWTTPTLRAGRAELHIQTGGDRRLANAMYSMTLQGEAGDSWLLSDAPLSALEPNGGTLDASFTGAFEPGQVYALITPTFNNWAVQQADTRTTIRTGNVTLTMDAGVPDAAGTLHLRRYNGVPNVRLVTDLARFQAALKPYQQQQTKLHQWSEAHPAPALLLRLSGHFGPDAYAVVPPAGVQVKLATE